YCEQEKPDICLAPLMYRLRGKPMPGSEDGRKTGAPGLMEQYVKKLKKTFSFNLKKIPSDPAWRLNEDRWLPINLKAWSKVIGRSPDTISNYNDLAEEQGLIER